LLSALVQKERDAQSAHIRTGLSSLEFLTLGRMWQNRTMIRTSLPRLLEDKKVEALLVRLERLQATTGKPPQSMRPMIRLSGTAHAGVFYST